MNAAEDRRYLAAVYGPRLGKVKIGSASVSFKSVDDIDLEVLAEMVRHAGRTITQRPATRGQPAR
ncbi:hypothetical protein ACFWUP_23520 [Nocardia sp. NPDC058658]|uniref:hypothetical protein n=1 Tax=Nocardia sp. NPDC058658 TaxID=3346580 RepID=UPI0036667BE1